MLTLLRGNLGLAKYRTDSNFYHKAYPTSLLLEDNDGTSALEHAILSEASIEVVKLLQHATAIVRDGQRDERQATSE